MNRNLLLRLLFVLLLLATCSMTEVFVSSGAESWNYAGFDAPNTGGGLLRSGRRGQALLAEYRGYRAHGFTAGQARYLTQPYQGVGHHWLARRIGYGRLNLPRGIMESRFNIMGRGMSRGQFYRSHALADPHLHGAAFPRALGGSWRASELGISTASRPLRWWYATPNASRYTIGRAAAAGGAWWLLSVMTKEATEMTSEITDCAIFSADFADDAEWNDEGDLIVPGGKAIAAHLVEQLGKRGIEAKQLSQHSYLSVRKVLRIERRSG